MNIADLQKKKCLLLECISGSKAYGLNTPQSDTDLKGVFVLPKSMFYGLETLEQVNNESNDEVYYELRRYVDLLLKNNPNILELLASPEDSILYKHPIMDHLKPEHFLSKLCNQTFAGYAIAQIKKARGLNKKIVNPVDSERKYVDDFCYVLQGAGSIPLKNWLEKNSFFAAECGLVKINHMREVYALFHQSQSRQKLKGISSGPNANDVSLSSVEAGILPLAILSFNKDGHSSYCRDYREYFEWVENRNQSRYETTLSSGKNYDAKNIMHTFRLLHMSEEIAREGKIIVRRPDRDYLLKIRSGAYEYDELIAMANEKIELIRELFEKSNLPEVPDCARAEEMLIEMRDRLYRE